MSKIIVTDCRVVAIDHVEFPESERINFTNNDIWSDLFRSNLNQLKCLKVLDMSDNYSSDFSPGPHSLDILELLTNFEDNVCFNSPNLQNLILKSSKPTKYKSILSFQVSFECESLTNLKIINLAVDLLDLDQLPNSLEELIINDLNLEIIEGNFFKFNKLKKLNLQNNQITFSMLNSQKFPSSLTHLNLSNNKIEDLSCLILDNCFNLKDLKLKEVTSERTPEGTTQLRNMLYFVDPHIDAILTNYDSEVIFEIVHGVEKNSILKSIYKKRRIC
ncbi:uncharacterized protein KGF55_004602 [Candida pseudojiufengensis]|uniref:uncharacterized protein n=1 Tax=Candida pseudojiufengensis TaxID=497109 RepID=UPI0022249640|nr:uncharacterized protein KGF55_004602 [Candida pseudojiufengensis]KAI5960310.1 hypothetical protein KGF55_004602 [Candida pseudojiufengensis]